MATGAATVTEVVTGAATVAVTKKQHIFIGPWLLTSGCTARGMMPIDAAAGDLPDLPQKVTSSQQMAR